MMFPLSILVLVTGLQPLVTGLQPLATSQNPDSLTTANPECFMTPSQIAAHNGYRLDSHWVTTEDGYILEIHNIPQRGAPVVFLQHGLLDSSMTWMLNGKEGL